MNNNNKSYRVHTNVNSDTLLHVHLRQDMDFLEILSLKLRQEEFYSLHTSNYGVIVGRVLASEAFGIPNVKVSIFIPIDDIDSQLTAITNLYPYTDVYGQNKDGIRYNLIPDNSSDDCYRIVGTFPNKRLVLDENTYIEIFDKYWKYTTVTNKAGDYFIPHVPIGDAQLHIDFDISDVGILSQRPRDMIYKGYTNTLFDNANQFKESTNLDSLTQIFSQNQSVYVYPFWGENDLNEIAITRCDMNVQYKFEPTCIFMGSIATDTYSTSIGHNCKPFRTSGYNNSLVAGEGTIEMIRKTTDGFIEEFQIQGNQLIDGDGVFCYQIPMNLDYVQTDEYGNIVPTDNPSKGIPTRTSVRFRISMNDTENDGVARHRAKYLVPNHPKLKIDDENGINPIVLDDKYTLESYYEFGTATNEDSFRDLYWNKVYTVKNYIPRVQVSKKAGVKNYTGIRTVNYNGKNNPAPFNKIRFNLSFTYRLSCILATIVLMLIGFVNKWVIGIWNSFLGTLAGICILKVCPFKFLKKFMIACVEFPFLTESDEGSCQITCFYPGCDNKHSIGKTKEKNPDCDVIENDEDIMKSKLEQLLAEENEAVNLDFYDDWLNGCLYMPLWYWKKRKKKKFFFGLFSKKAVNAFCNCDKKNKTKLMFPCAFSYYDDFEISTNLSKYDGEVGRWHDKEYNRFNINYGIIKEKETTSGLRAYYYAPGVRINPVSNINADGDVEQDMHYVVLFATDIVLLGSLDDCDLNGVPQMFKNLASTTSNVMPVNRDVEVQCDTDEDADIIQETTGMDFWTDPNNNNDTAYKGNGYFMDIGCSTLETLPKTCVNAERLSELGVNLDQSFNEEIAAQNSIAERQNYADGMITKVEIADHETRAMFATLNHNGLQTMVYDRNLGYYFYKFKYLYPIEFDGRMSDYSIDYTRNNNEGRFTTDNLDRSYIRFRLGDVKFFYGVHEGENGGSTFPVYNNSYYFYFGITEGKTAIDKFNSKFFSECYQNYQEPFLVSVETSGSSWYSKDENCEYIEDKLGRIEVTFDRLSTPYTYSIINSLGEEILTDVECELETLVFDKYFDKIFESGESNTTCFEPSGDDADKYEPKFPVINDTYTFTVIDSKGHSVTKTIELEGQSISLGFSSVDLAVKFYESQTHKDEICDAEDMAGGILIQTVVIDGIIYQVNSASTTYNTYELVEEDGDVLFRFVNNSDTSTCKTTFTVKITPNSIVEYKSNNSAITSATTFQECICEDNIIFDENGLYIPIWIPQGYSVKTKQVPCADCGDIENVSYDSFTILNGTPFDLVVNNVKLKFIMGKKYDNEYFKNNVLNGWFNINKEYILSNDGTENYIYSFDDFENIKQNEDYWNEVIEDLTYKEGNSVSDSAYDDILEYKIQSILNLASAAFVQTDAQNDFSTTVSGGRKPSLIRSFLPMYDEITNEETPNGLTIFYRFSNDTVGEVTPTHPNVVGWNYRYFNANDQEWKDDMYRPNGIKYGYNTLFSDSNNVGNYFAGFTDNAGLTLTEYVCEVDRIYNAAPSKAIACPDNCCAGGQICINGEIDDINSVYNDVKDDYFRALFIDRRLDYNMIIMTPYEGEDLIDLKENEFDWTKGRISGITINGIELAYDNSYNCIGTPTVEELFDPNTSIDYEYYPILDENQENTPKIYYNNNVENKRLYIASVRCGRETIDLRNNMWAYESDTNNRVPDNVHDFNDGIKTYFNVNHEGDYKTVTNGDFNENNYPTIRLFDVAQTPNSTRMEFEFASCAYQTSITYDDNGNPQSICEMGENIEFDIPTNKAITFKNTDIDDCIANQYGNVEFTGNSVGSSITFVGNTVNIDFSVVADDDTNMTVRTRIPRWGRIFSNNNSISRIKSRMTEEDINNILLNELDEVTITKTPEGIERGGRDSNGFYYLVDTNNDNAIIEDDDLAFSQVEYGLRSTKSLVGITIQFPCIVGGADFLYVALDKKYTNEDAQEFLSKKIRVLNMSNLIDTRSFILTCTDAYEEKVADDSTESSGTGTGSGSATVPGYDASGNPTTSTGSVNVGVEVDVENTAITQVVSYSITFGGTLNHELMNYEDMSFAIKYVKGGETYVMNNLVPTSTSDTSISFTVRWAGDMRNVFLDGGIDATLFMKTSVGFVYMASFHMNGASRTDTTLS